MPIVEMSEVTNNMMKWYPFLREDKCLVIGDELDVVSNSLRQVVDKIVTVSDIAKYTGEEKYDYILVYECATKKLLERTRSMISEDGKILIFSDNRIGLRYMTGAMDRHTDQYFSGLNDYVDSEQKGKGYSRKELCLLLEDAGFEFYKFYYPYPDERIVKEVFTDKTLEELEYGREYYNFDAGTLSLFSEVRTADTLREEGVIACFANYFFVEVSLSGKFVPIIYAKVNSFRRREFQIATLIKECDGNRFVEKIGLNEAAVPHVKKILKRNNAAIVQEISNGIRCRYFTCPNLDQRISQYIDEGDVAKIYEALEAVYRPYFEQAHFSEYYTQEFAHAFGDIEGKEEVLTSLKTIRPANIDMICDNIMLEEDGIHFIDEEWVFDFDIPILFILWRCIRELYAKHVKLPSLISYENFLSHFQITEQMDEIFLQWTLHFVNTYVGTQKYEKKAIERLQIDLRDVYLNNFNAAESKLYFDMGQGFSEDNTSIKMLQTDGDGNFTLNYQIPENTQKVRWKPVEIRYCCCEIQNTNGTLLSHNGEDTEEGQVFTNGDPQYLFDLPSEGESEFVIRGKIKISKLLTSSRKYMEKATNLYNENEYLKGDIQKLKDEYSSLVKQKELLTEQKELLTEQYELLEKEHQRILESKRWRVVQFLCGIIKR